MAMEISAMYEALDNMDDYALMANVKPIGPHKVLTGAIAELEQLRQRVAELEKDAIRYRELLTLAKIAIEGVYDHNQNPALASCSGGQYEAFDCKVALEAINEVLK